MSEQINTKRSKSFGEYIKQIGAFAILITSFALGLTIAGAFWSSAVSVLNSQLNIAREETNRATQELMQVKADYLTYRNNIKPDNRTILDTIQLTKTNQDDKTLKLVSSVEEKSILVETSDSFFNGDVTISLIAIAFEGDPLRHKVLANISSTNGQVIKVDKQDIGSVVIYKTKNLYKITILSAETFSASFQVAKIVTE